MARPDDTEIARFVYHEARLMDAHRFAEWEALWTDDGVYWVPIGDDYDPLERVSIIYDDRELIAARVRRLAGDHAFAQDPKSTLLRVVSNIEVGELVGDEVEVHSAYVLHEARHGVIRPWAARVEHRLRAGDDGRIQMSFRKVMLVNSTDPLPNASFLL